MPRVVGRLRREKDEIAVLNGAVTAKHPLASHAAVEVLERGGNAVDAAVVAQLCTGVLLPQASGLAGGGYLVFHEAASGQTHVVDYASESPGAAHGSMYRDHPEGGFGSSQGWRRMEGDENWRGWRSISVPGVVAGLSMALERWGTLRWAQALAPAIQLAEEGFPIPQELLHQVLVDWRSLIADTGSTAVFTDGGAPYRPNARIRYPLLARTLRRLAEAGPDDFYRGQIAREIAADMAAGGGHITADDLARYRPRLPEPALEITYRGVTLRGPRASCGSATVFQVLRLLEGYDLAASGPLSAGTLHLWDQAMRLALMDRVQYLGDPEKVDVPFTGLLHPDYAAARRALIREDGRIASFEPGDPWAYEGRPTPAQLPERSRPWEPGGTQHVNVADAQRNVVTLTDTLVGWACVVLPRTGIVMNNAMAWHDPVPGRTNSIQPRSRGLNNMAPTLLLRDGRPWAAVGARGGRRILQTVAQVISNLVDHGMGPQQAVAGPHADSSEPPLRLEQRVPQEARDQLAAMGHTLAVMETRVGAGAGAIVIDGAAGVIRAGEDPSGESAAVGW